MCGRRREPRRWRDRAAPRPAGAARSAGRSGAGRCHDLLQAYVPSTEPADGHLVSMHPATREQKSLVRDLGRRAGTSECLQLQESLQTKVFFGSTRDFEERQIMWQFKCHKRYPLALAGVLINTRPIEDTDQVQLINILCHTLYASN